MVFNWAPDRRSTLFNSPQKAKVSVSTSLMSPPVSSGSTALGPRNSCCKSLSDSHHLQLKSERFIWSGRSTKFEDQELQRRTRDKIQQLIEEGAAAHNDNNALIAMKVLKYRKLSDHATTRCV